MTGSWSRDFNVELCIVPIPCASGWDPGHAFLLWLGARGSPTLKVPLFEPVTPIWFQNQNENFGLEADPGSLPGSTSRNKLPPANPGDNT